MKLSVLIFSLVTGALSLLIFTRIISQIIYIATISSLFVFLVVYFIGGTLVKLISKKKTLYLGQVFLAALIIGLCLACRTTIMGTDIYYIPTASMEPTIQVGDLVICDLWRIETFEVNDIALFKHPTKKDEVYIKRINAIRTFEKQGHKFFMRGDNSLQSEDSRVFGEIDQADIICKATSVISPSINPKDWNIRSL